MIKKLRCCDCFAGEHNNYDDDVILVKVLEPNGRKLFKRAFLCGDHRQMYFDDGYLIEVQTAAHIRQDNRLRKIKAIHQTIAAAGNNSQSDES